MEPSFPKDGLFDLSADDLMSEAERLYKDFFSSQTAISAFRLAVILYHLAEWVSRNGNSEDKYLMMINADDPHGGWKAELLSTLHSYEHYKVLRSICNNSKHHTLTSSKAYEKRNEYGFRAGKSVAGERLGQSNLAVIVDGESVWLREVFSYVIAAYRKYFSRVGVLRIVRDVADGKQET